jgi:hypothetical protein
MTTAEDALVSVESSDVGSNSFVLRRWPPILTINATPTNNPAANMAVNANVLCGRRIG